MIDNKELFVETGSELPAALLQQVDTLEQQGNTTILVTADQHFIGVLALMNVARAEAKDTIAQLRTLGIKKMIMLNGDTAIYNVFMRQISLAISLQNILQLLAGEETG